MAGVAFIAATASLRRRSPTTPVRSGTSAITDEGLTHLTELKRLESLWLDGTSVTVQGIATLKRALPNYYISSIISEREIAKAVEVLDKEATSATKQ
jgi:hypothetical protein